MDLRFPMILARGRIFVDAVTKAHEPHWNFVLTLAM